MAKKKIDLDRAIEAFRWACPNKTGYFGMNKFASGIYKRNKAKGFHDGEMPLGEQLMLVVSELSEALEADRRDGWCKERDVDLSDALSQSGQYGFADWFRENVKDTVEDEIADAFIRLFDLVGTYGIDIEKHIALKLAYNKTREYKHGKRY